MEELIEKIVEIIGDYREEDINFLYQQRIDNNHVKRWIQQFDEDDREFILTELLHLLPQSYLTKETTLRILGKEFETLRKDFGYDSVENFLDETRFLDCQEAGKSQKVFLALIDDTLQDQYDYSLEDCGQGEIKNWIYLDDVLADNLYRSLYVLIYLR